MIIEAFVESWNCATEIGTGPANFAALNRRTCSTQADCTPGHLLQ